jgi:hypothetical protein
MVSEGCLDLLETKNNPMVGKDDMVLEFDGAGNLISLIDRVKG